ncbi:Uncharacterized protein MSYG_3473 [Malassezia sympodialis ATCC 42132]|uniref:DAGKc domain-containing protein n=1 Tax=Malassezia sympodialis (strain ATCC 42132) TaxID=1230383 RepID=A0A1M8AAB2_MALS4|nr:Uncharacterized protein MSYG_3473 [Malassezia sympodialis ATCC 42132]
MAVCVVYNPAAGKGLAEVLIREYIQPQLNIWKIQKEDRPEPIYHVTNPIRGAKDAVRYLSPLTQTSTLILLGGDGTTHEIIEEATEQFGQDLSKLQLVLVPTGTGNALFQSHFGPGPSDNEQWRLRSFEAFLQGDVQSLIPLSFLQVDPYHSTATVVASHALHAAILRDSEVLRTEHPGIERFKIAAEENMNTWFDATLFLQPLDHGHVLRYDPVMRDFKPVSAAFDDYLCHGDGRVEMAGVFIYMNAMLVDRLEADFIPAPFAGVLSEPHLRRPPEAVDIIVIRPYRSPRVQTLLKNGDDVKGMHNEYAQDVIQPVLFEGMYRGGVHVDFTYTPDGQVDIQGSTEGPRVVEYFRASGYEWVSSPDDSQAHTTCVDGTIMAAARTHTKISPVQGVKLWSKPWN